SRDRTDKTAFRAYAIVKLSRKPLADCVSEQKPCDDAAKLSIGETQIACDHRGQHRNRQSIDVVDQGGEKDQADDPPTQPSELEPNLGRSRFSSLCVQHYSFSALTLRSLRLRGDSFPRGDSPQRRR